MKQIRFDKMMLADLDVVYQLEINNYPVPWSKGIIKDCIKSDYSSVLLKNSDKIIGYAFLMTAYDESHLLNMCIDKSHQGKGLGRKLLKYLENICIYSQSKSFLLEVRKSNPVAQSLYASFGFEKIGVRKSYYRTVGGREDAIVMKKQFKIEN
jgi:ribosomal-protein-alanine N-acetyltransferase